MENEEFTNENKQEETLNENCNCGCSEEAQTTDESFENKAEPKTAASVAESFAKIFENLGIALKEIFNDPELEKKAKDLGKAAKESACEFVGRFKDEEVKNKFDDVGKAAKDFGSNVSSTVKQNKEKVKTTVKTDISDEIEKINAQLDELKKKKEELEEKLRNNLSSDEPVEAEATIIEDNEESKPENSDNA